VQKDNSLQTLDNLNQIPDNGGFLIAPFRQNEKTKTHLIRPDILLRNGATDEQFRVLQSIKPYEINGSLKESQSETEKEAFIDQVNQTIKAIEKGIYEKVVLSRIKTLDGDFSARLGDIFQLLCSSYKNAFVYLFRMKGHCWAGATPEPLICSQGEEIETVSLAGTRPYSETNRNIENWNHKERQEQDYVTRYIESVLAQFNISQIIKTGPYTKKAGKLLHLRTDFRFPVQSIENNLSALIGALHPTSAVCGMPTEEAMNFINCIEIHDREYYSGFLGPVRLNDHFQLFVNLRCMKVLEKQLTLFVGSGITSESVAEEEWEETEIKADTLLSVVQQIH
jgi:isochorismate synthase